jgi:hypothetical protein
MTIGGFSMLLEVETDTTISRQKSFPNYNLAACVQYISADEDKEQFLKPIK